MRFFRPSGVKTPEENAAFMSCLKARPTKLKSFPQPVKPNSKIHFSAGLKSLCENPCAKRFCSVGLQADTLDSSSCPPEGGRYIIQNQVLKTDSEACATNARRPQPRPRTAGTRD